VYRQAGKQYQDRDIRVGQVLATDKVQIQVLVVEAVEQVALGVTVLQPVRLATVALV
jgi:hypothetical protein